MKARAEAGISALSSESSDQFSSAPRLISGDESPDAMANSKLGTLACMSDIDHQSASRGSEGILMLGILVRSSEYPPREMASSSSSLFSRDRMAGTGAIGDHDTSTSILGCRALSMSAAEPCEPSV